MYTQGHWMVHKLYRIPGVCDRHPESLISGILAESKKQNKTHQNIRVSTVTCLLKTSPQHLTTLLLFHIRQFYNEAYSSLFNSLLLKPVNPPDFIYLTSFVLS